MAPLSGTNIRPACLIPPRVCILLLFHHLGHPKGQTYFLVAIPATSAAAQVFFSSPLAPQGFPLVIFSR